MAQVTLVYYLLMTLFFVKLSCSILCAPSANTYYISFSLFPVPLFLFIRLTLHFCPASNMPITPIRKPRIVKKKVKKVKRHQSDRYLRVKVSFCQQLPSFVAHGAN